MPGAARVWLAIKALPQLGPLRLAENGLYRAGLELNLWKTPLPSADGRGFALNLEALPPAPVNPPGRLDPDLLREAHELEEGQVRLFGSSQAQPLELKPAEPLQAWAEYERGRAAWGGEDIKFCWEPARFGWAVPLARAYRQSGDEAFARAFWTQFENFREGNPPYFGPNWTSGQEMALRVIAWGFVLRALASSTESSPARMVQLASWVAVHAARIPPTLIYARSQDNNHLLSEAAGLYTAGLLLPEHPQAASWRRLGWKWFNCALQHQIDKEGGYIQQSLNYHRMMLQLSLWMDALARRHGDVWPDASRARLGAAARWLWARLDPATGRAPNLGHNDGSCLFAFGEYGDQRSTVQAAGRAFLGQDLLAAGAWDELSQWLGLRSTINPVKGADEAGPAEFPALYRDASGVVLRSAHSWATLRAVHFQNRPGQADQLQVDLWQKGVNVFLDAGTYRYNAPPPWDNGLASSMVHNAPIVDGREPMTRAGRFLWLDWDQAEVLSCIPGCAVAERSGYRGRGVRHKRTLECQRGETWTVTDELLAVGVRSRAHDFSLSWLLPDGEWSLEGSALTLGLPGLRLRLQVECLASPVPRVEVQVVRAGELLAGVGTDAARLGWFSPTYGERLPALSLRVKLRSGLPLKLRTSIQFLSP